MISISCWAISTFHVGYVVYQPHSSWNISIKLPVHGHLQFILGLCYVDKFISRAARCTSYPKEMGEELLMCRSTCLRVDGEYSEWVGVSKNM